MQHHLQRRPAERSRPYHQRGWLRELGCEQRWNFHPEPGLAENPPQREMGRLSYAQLLVQQAFLRRLRQGP